MAVVIGGISTGTISLDYKFAIPIGSCTARAVGSVVLSDTFTHDGDSWQLTTTKHLGTDGQNSFLACELHLVKSSSTKKKVARICHFAGGLMISSGPTAVFCHRGDKCDPRSQGLWSFWIKDNHDQKIIVEVLKNLGLKETGKLPPIEAPKSRMSAEVLKWFQKENFGDITIVAADGKKFSCHRGILSARSEVFELMFSCPMKESRENLVDIDSYSGDVVTQLLVFLYTDECEMGPIADRLYSAAHQYQIDRLKILCESAMAANLSAESIVKTFRLATFYHLDELLARCVEFLDSHKAELSMADLLAESMKVQEGNEGRKEQK